MPSRSEETQRKRHRRVHCSNTTTTNPLLCVLLCLNLLLLSVPPKQNMTEPLPPAIQMLNQRFLAEGCFAGDAAEALWQEILARVQDNNDSQAEVVEPSLTLSAALAQSNVQLAAAGLEIRGIVDNNTRYYAMVNKEPDSIAKAGLASGFASTEEVNYIRLILEHLSEGPCSRANLLNLRNSLKGNESLTTDQAVVCLDRLITQHWVWAAAATTAASDQDSDDDQTSRRRRPPARYSMQTQLALAPRAYMELSYMLVDQFGMEHADLPQQIVF